MCVCGTCFTCQNISHLVTSYTLCHLQRCRPTWHTRRRKKTHTHMHSSFSFTSQIAILQQFRQKAAPHNTARPIIPHDLNEAHHTTQTSNIPCKASIAYIKEPEAKQIQKPTHTNTTHDRAQAWWIFTLLMTKQLVWAPEPVPETFESPNHWTPEHPMNPVLRKAGGQSGGHYPQRWTSWAKSLRTRFWGTTPEETSRQADCDSKVAWNLTRKMHNAEQERLKLR